MRHVYLICPLQDIDIKKVNGAPQYAFLQYCDIASVCKAIKKMDGEYLGSNRLKVRIKMCTLLLIFKTGILEIFVWTLLLCSSSLIHWFNMGVVLFWLDINNFFLVISGVFYWLDTTAAFLTQPIFIYFLLVINVFFISLFYS